jgi:hypothetical protein
MGRGEGADIWGGAGRGGVPACCAPIYRADTDSFLRAVGTLLLGWSWRLEVLELPIYWPDAREQASAPDYAAAVQKVMAEGLGVPAVRDSQSRLLFPPAAALSINTHERPARPPTRQVDTSSKQLMQAWQRRQRRGRRRLPHPTSSSPLSPSTRMVPTSSPPSSPSASPSRLHTKRTQVAPEPPPSLSTGAMLMTHADGRPSEEYSLLSP